MRSFKLSSLTAALAIIIGSTLFAQSAELPNDDPGLFSYLFAQKTIPAEWIYAPASKELTPAMMSEIANRISAEGGQYQDATKTARGWQLDFQNGTVRARIIRAPDHKIIGVFFSALE